MCVVLHNTDLSLEVNKGVVEICYCGHPVGKHQLAKTEYARCDEKTCHCTGGVRVAVIVEESGDYNGLPSATQTNGRYFKRRYSSHRAGHPLTGAVEKCTELGIGVSWVAQSCDRCGWVWEGMLHPYIADFDGNAQVNVVEFGIPLLLCGICDTEVQILADARSGRDVSVGSDGLDTDFFR